MMTRWRPRRSRPMGRGLRALQATAVRLLAVIALAVAFVTGSAEAAPPSGYWIESIGVYSGELKVNVRVREGGGSPVKARVQWKSGDQEYDSSRELVGYVYDELVITGLTDGVAYKIRVRVFNDDGEGAYWTESTGFARPGNQSEQLRRYVEEEVVEEHEGSFPWVREAWNHFERGGRRIVVRTGSHSVHVNCSNGGEYGLARCSAGTITISKSVLDRLALLESSESYSGSFSEHELRRLELDKDFSILHELAHVFLLASDAPSAPVPVALGSLYFESLPCRPDTRRRTLVSLGDGGERYADMLATLVLEDRLPFPRSLNTYWQYCPGDGSSHTQEALEVVRSVAGGQVPSWFAETYHDANGEPDLERVWADLRDIGGAEGAVGISHLRNAFGGYCNVVKRRGRPILSGEWGRVTVNPWRDGGCLPPGPGAVAAAAAGAGKLAVSWDRPSPGASLLKGYRLQWKSGEESFDSSREAIVTEMSNRVSHTIEGLTDGTEYSMRVQAYNHDGDGAWSDAATATSASTDERPPELLSASVDGQALVLTWNEALDSDAVPAGSAFAVTAGAETHGVVGVALSGKSAKLTLGSPVEAAQAVTLSYTVPEDAEAPRLRDAAGNAAPAIAGAAVTNATLPVVTITAEFPKARRYMDEPLFRLTRTGPTAEYMQVFVRFAQTSDYFYVDGKGYQVWFPVGQRSGTFTLNWKEGTAAPASGGSVTATVESGDGFTLGNPGGATVEVFEGR